MAKNERPGVAARGKRRWSGFAQILPPDRQFVTSEMACLRLAWRERAVNRPFGKRASLKLDRALMKAEAMGVRHA